MVRVRKADIEIRGLRPLLKELKRASVELPREVRVGNLAIATDIAQRTKQRGSSLGSVHAHVTSGVRAGATQRAAKVVLDAGKQPAVFGAEFGGGRRPRTRQFPPWRGSGRNAGYMLYPTIRERSRSIVEDYAKIIDHVIRRGGIGA